MTEMDEMLPGSIPCVSLLDTHIGETGREGREREEEKGERDREREGGGRGREGGQDTESTQYELDCSERFIVKADCCIRRRKRVCVCSVCVCNRVN